MGGRGGGGERVAADGGLADIPTGQKTDLQSYHYTGEPCSSHLHFKAEIKSGLFIFCVSCFPWAIFFKFFCLVVFVVFLVQHNLKRLKAFQPKCGGETGKALFLHKTSIPHSANESGTS